MLLSQTAGVTSKASDQTALVCSLIRDFVCHTCHIHVAQINMDFCLLFRKVFRMIGDVWGRGGGDFEKLSTMTRRL